jgi:hypothetical protein
VVSSLSPILDMVSGAEGGPNIIASISGGSCIAALSPLSEQGYVGLSSSRPFRVAPEPNLSLSQTMNIREKGPKNSHLLCGRAGDALAQAEDFEASLQFVRSSTTTRFITMSRRIRISPLFGHASAQ